MQEQNCYTIAIKQQTCQNGVEKVIDNVYTNVTHGMVIPLSFGYTVTIVNTTPTMVTITISNPGCIPTLTFNIPCDSFKIFDLPKESGTLRVYIGAKKICCQETILHCGG